ncbi:MAG: hypothetical protein ACP6KW_05010 [Candidatus Thorarchaeota archaeon]
MTRGRQTNEHVIFVFNKMTGMAPYSHEFTSDLHDPQVLSGFVSAMGSFMGEVTGTDEERWKTVFGSDSTLLVEGGTWCMGVLVASRETSEGRSKLRAVISEFEDSFHALKDSDSFEGKIFKEFDNFVRRVFLGDRVTERTTVLDVDRETVRRLSLERPSKTFKLHKLLLSAWEGASLQELADATSVDIEEARELMAVGIWNHAVQVSFVPVDGDILSLSERTVSPIFSKQSSLLLTPETIRVLGRLDGKTRLIEVLEKAGLKPTPRLLKELGRLIDQGMIQRVSLEQRLLLASHCVLSRVVNVCAQKMGKVNTIGVLLKEKNNGISSHRWLALTQVTWDCRVSIRLPEGLGPSDFDEFCDALEYLTQRVIAWMSSTSGGTDAQDILPRSRRECHDTWSSQILDMVY